ncbi:MAG: helix-turn-helix transcriptional regulator, partial [Paucibacter sp.]|nr:helix-turn-helix transcriptional regulator [Roseateles sp.]
MHKVRIKPVWTLCDQVGRELPARVLELLTEVQVHGSLSKACRETGASYRHAWSLIRDAEAQLGHSLLSMARGKGSTLSPLAQKLVWAGHRIQARLGTLLTSLESELEAEIERVVARRHDVVRLFASHGFAVETLLKTLTAQGQSIEHKYMGSQEAVASWHAGHCELAGFHVPIGAFEADALAHYARWLGPDSRLIHITQRRQGLLVAHDNPLGIHQLRDLTRTGIRFVNRQATSGTRFLLECMLDQAGIAPGQIEGFDLNEYTHAAVAAYVASGMADVGLGVEPPARH